MFIRLADEDNWGARFPACDGYAQSPINIHPNSLFEENRLSLQLMNSYNAPITEATLSNNGHTGNRLVNISTFAHMT